MGEKKMRFCFYAEIFTQFIDVYLAGYITVYLAQLILSFAGKIHPKESKGHRVANN